MGRRADHTRADLEELIHQAGLDLIRAGGMRELTARKLAARIGYTPGMLYTIYDDQVALIAAMAARELRSLVDELDRVRTAGGSWENQIWEGTDRLRAVLIQDPARALLFRTALRSESPNDSLGSALKELKSALSKLFLPLANNREAAEDQAAIFLAWGIGAQGAGSDRQGDLLLEQLIRRHPSG